MSEKEQLIQYCIENSETTKCHCQNLVDDVSSNYIGETALLTFVSIVIVGFVIYMIYEAGKNDGKIEGRK